MSRIRISSSHLVRALAALVVAGPLLALWPRPALAETSEPKPQGTLSVPDAARPGPNFDVERATRAYLDTLPPDKRARSDAYFEGGYWLQLWGTLYTLAVAALLLNLGWSARMRDWAERVSRRPFLRNVVYAAQCIVAVTILFFPLSLYQDYFREHQYGISNLTLGTWIVEQLKGLGLGVSFGAPVVAVVLSVVRRRAGHWWLPASVLCVAFLFLQLFITPVFLAPAFNDYRALGEGPVRDAVVALARGNGVPADDIVWFDASKQTSRISANVSGFLNTTRISLNDNLLRDTSLPEIRAVMAHELGHYVLHHPLHLIVELGLVIAAGLAAAQWSQRRLLARFAGRWGVRDVGDVAGFPLIFAVVSLWLFLMTPVTNSIIRTVECEADLFGLNAAREAHGFASVSMRLATYRKLEPSPLEEIVFYDHPSGRSRVHAAMTWLEEQDAGG